MAPPCVVVGLVASQYGVVRAMRFNRTRFFFGLLRLLLCRLPLLMFLVCARTLWNVIL
jgi:hypothetical protein